MTEREQAIADRIGISGIRVVIDEEQGMGFRDAVGVEFVLRQAIKLPPGDSVDDNLEMIARELRIWLQYHLSDAANEAKAVVA